MGEEGFGRPALPLGDQRAQLLLQIGLPRRVFEEGGPAGVIEGAQHAGHVLERRTLGPALRQGAGRFALEVEDLYVVLGDDHLAQVEVAVQAGADGIKAGRRQILQATEDIAAPGQQAVDFLLQCRTRCGTRPLERREGLARLRVNLFDYLDTGLFLDHRPLRLRLHEEARDTRFLNLFGYTGAATVHAALGGARTTTTVDLSATYLEWCAANLQENGFGGARHRLAQADVLQWLRADTGQYDLVFCDPPTFSNSKRAGDFDIQRTHVELLRLAVARLAPGGVLYFSNNFRRFRLDEAALSAFAAVEDISAATIPPDFARDPRIHRCWRLHAR